MVVDHFIEFDYDQGADIAYLIIRVMLVSCACEHKIQAGDAMHP